MVTVSSRYNLRSNGKGYHLRSDGKAHLLLRSISTSDSKLKAKSPPKNRRRKDPHYAEMNELANLALQKYNSDKGTNFKRVKTVYTGAGLIAPFGLVRHLGFNAREQDKPRPPLMTFFAELTSPDYHNFHVNLCQCLGRTYSLPEDGANHGCTMCFPGMIHHPSDVNFQGKDPEFS